MFAGEQFPLVLTLNQKLNLKGKKLLNLLLKIAIVVFAAIFIGFKLSNNENLRNFKQIIAGLEATEVIASLGSILVLMFGNWILEALKWKFLVKRVEVISTQKAIESVFCGLTWAVFTPNRIGEYGGRVLFLSPRKRILGVIAMGVGAVGQMIITNVLGSFATCWFTLQFLNLSTATYSLLIGASIITSILLLLFYFNIRILKYWLEKIRFFHRFRKFFGLLAVYKKKDLLIVFLFSISRFIVFTSQYCIILYLLIPQLPFFGMLMMIFILFFIQSALPSLDLLDIGVRTMTATYVFSFITHQDVAVMASTAYIWFINLIVPAILGSIFVFKLNFFGNVRN